MRRLILGAVILLSVISWSVAWADDDAWAPDQVIHVKKDKTADEAPREVTAAGSHRDREAADTGNSADSDSAGSYFGLGDDYVLIGQDESGNAVFTDQQPQSKSQGPSNSKSGKGKGDSDTAPTERGDNSRAAESDMFAHYPQGSDGDGYTNENVYGPMWGVPKDAVGLDGFSGNPYPGMVDGTDGNTAAAQDSDKGTSGAKPRAKPARQKQADDSDSSDNSGDGDNVQRNHHINRDDPNKW